MKEMEMEMEIEKVKGRERREWKRKSGRANFS
jgi:hypothetical protein